MFFSLYFLYRTKEDLKIDSNFFSRSGFQSNKSLAGYKVETVYGGVLKPMAARKMIVIMANYKMKSKSKIGPLILKILLFLIGLGLGAFSFLILLIIIKKFEMVGLLGFLIIGYISITSIHFVINSLKTITIDTTKGECISIKYIGIFEKIWSIDRLKGYNTWLFTNNFGTYKGILIETIDGEQIYLTEFDTENYIEIRDVFVSLLERRNEIKLKVWTSFNRSAFIFLIFFILFMLIVKVFE